MIRARSIDAPHDCEDEHEYFEERAGILEFDGGFVREEAERLARMAALARYFAGDAAIIIRKASMEGVEVRLVDGNLRVGGPAEARDRWLPTLRQFRAELLIVLDDDTQSKLPSTPNPDVAILGQTGK